MTCHFCSDFNVDGLFSYLIAKLLVEGRFTIGSSFENRSISDLTWSTCQVVAEETPLGPDTVLGLRPDSSTHKLQINFCCLNAKYCIWLYRQKKCAPKLKGF